MEKINIAELLKDCPKGMELDCTMYENVYFDKIYDKDCLYQIGCYTINDGVRNSINFTKYGKFNTTRIAKCVIFPKGKTTWEGFIPPCKFEDGDVVATKNGLFIGIVKIENGVQQSAYVAIYGINNLSINISFRFERFATEEEKEKLFKTIKDNGYTWNEETKTLDKLIIPKFKVGDRIIKRDSIVNSWIVSSVSSEYYGLQLPKGFEGIGVLSIKEQDEYELVPNKFDITTLKPFDKVLYRMHDKDTWCNSFYSFYKSNHHFVTSLTIVKQCIPYEGNEHLLGTTDDCDNFYKTWE